MIIFEKNIKNKMTFKIHILFATRRYLIKYWFSREIIKIYKYYFAMHVFGKNKSLKILKRSSENVNRRRTDNVMVKRKEDKRLNNDQWSVMFCRPCFNRFWRLKYIPRLFSEYMLTFRVEEPMKICVTN
jgi:hypothetical protein